MTVPTGSISARFNKFSTLLNRNQTAFTNLWVSIFFILTAIGIYNHAMWRDELNVWLMVRDSSSLVNLFQNIKYEGHPGLWYLCLYLLSQFTHNPAIMQVFHLLLATGCVYLWFRFSPFTRLQKVIFSFGYLPFYEYSVISRNYAIGVLLIFTFCTLFSRRTKSYLVLSVILFLIANTNAYGLLISISLGITLVLEYALKLQPTKISQVRRGDLVASLLIFILGIVISLAQLIPPADSALAGGSAGWTLTFNLQHLLTTLTRIWSGYITILVPNDSHYWEMILFSALAIGLLGFACLILIRKPIALLFYLCSTIIILLFTYVKFMGGPRHYGHLYLLFIIALWIGSHDSESSWLTQILDRLPAIVNRVVTAGIRFCDRYKRAFILVILCAQLAGGIVAYGRDLFLPFSASRATAKFIQNQQLDQLFIVGSRDYAISPLCGYLNRKIYYPESQKIGSFILFTTARKQVDTTEVLAQVSQLVTQKHSNILLILNSELDVSRPDLQLSLLSKFTHSFMGDEKYYLYLVSQAKSY